MDFLGVEGPQSSTMTAAPKSSHLDDLVPDWMREELSTGVSSDFL